MKRVLTIIAVLVCVFALAMATGCQSIAEKATETAIEKGTGGKVDLKDGSVTVEGEKGEKATISEGGEIPESMPSDVPVYAGTKVVASVESDDPSGGKAINVTLGSQDDSAKVNTWYLDELEKGGWKITTKVSSEGNHAIVAEKGTNQLQVSIAADSGGDNKTTINLMVTPKQ